MYQIWKNLYFNFSLFPYGNDSLQKASLVKRIPTALLCTIYLKDKMLTISILSYSIIHNLYLRMFNEGTSILVAYTGTHFYIVCRNMLQVMAKTSNVPHLKSILTTPGPHMTSSLTSTKASFPRAEVAGV
jgi:hypothetical protein